MQTLTVGELKASFSEVLEKVKGGERIAISYGKKREKVAVIVPYSDHVPAPGRNLGILEGRAECIIHDDFEITDSEMLTS